MNPHLLTLARLSCPSVTVKPVSHDQSDPQPSEDKASFEVLADDGKVIGYVKAWHDATDYAGFVHFDADGNILDWKVFNEYSRQ